VVAAAHSMTFDTGRASPLFAINDRHAVAVTAEGGRWRWLKAAERERYGEPAGRRTNQVKKDGVAHPVVAVE
jgi:hypothetical protein